MLFFGEGILEYEIKELLLQHIKKDHCYSLDYLNQQITETELGYMESSDRPSTISLNTLESKDHKLKQEGAVYAWGMVYVLCVLSHEAFMTSVQLYVQLGNCVLYLGL